MSVFIPPTPTGRLAVVDGSGIPISNPDPFNQVPSSGNDNDEDEEDDGSAPALENENTTDSDALGDSGSSSPTNNKGIESSSEGMSLGTKIGIGVGAGAGSILLVVVATLILWKKRMGRRRPSPTSSPFARDTERGASPTPQEKAKLDFESEHDVEFDFGGFFRERAVNAARANAAAAVATAGSGVATGAPGGGTKLAVVNAGEDDRLPAFETPQHQPQQQAVAELDGGEVPAYRGVVGVGR